MRWRSFCKQLAWVLLLTVGVESAGTAPVLAQSNQDERFKDVEIRVIRPRFFNKRGKVEAGAQFSTVMNEAFIYTFMASGIVAYHFTETFALEALASFGFTLDKEDKRVLFDEFEIKTKIFRTLYAIEGVLQYTPIYGKWQLASGRLIYFDTYLSVGGGTTAIDWKYSDFCTPPKNPEATPIPSDTVKPYPTFMLGLGQRYFLNKELSVRWDIRNHSLFYNKIDSECDQVNGETGSGVHNNITLQIGATKFF